MKTIETENKIKNMINELKLSIKSYGLLNSGSEAEIITTIFLYKFLNDKFMYNLKKYAQKKNLSIEELENNKNELSKFYNANAKDVVFKIEDTIQSLIKHIEDDDFYKQFDKALQDINDDERNDVFRIEGVNREKQDLFKKISNKIDNEKDKATFAKDIFATISQDKIDFSDAFDEKFDFFASVFEYLVKDYNKDNGANGEYYTPQSCAKIIASILVDQENSNGVEIYDPCAGTGTLIMHLAHEIGSDDGINKATIYTQDLSQKSTDFLRINLLLNGLTESLHNVRKGDTLLNPVHFQQEGEESSGLKTFDYIVSNPPFKMDFSKTVSLIEKKFKDTDRFKDGIPEIPKKDLDSMPIYLMFIQHILYSLKDNGKAAIVVPTGFITAKNGIENKIRTRIIDNNWVTGCISMPPNIFATTGTNVSIIFIDKNNTSNDIILINATNMGEKYKDGKNQRTFLSDDDTNDIISIFKNKEIRDDISVVVPSEKVKEKKYSLSAGQYFEIKIEKKNYTQQEFENNLENYKENLNNYFDKNNEIEERIKKIIEGIKYE